MSILNKKGAFWAVFGSMMFLSGCSQLQPSPVEQVQKVQKAEMTQNQSEPVHTVKRSVVKNQQVSLFVCAKNKEVKVTKNKVAKKNQTVSVTYAGTTHRLSPAVTKNGKKYSNIRWIWWEPQRGKATLTDNRQRVLAEECVKSPDRQMSE